MDEAELCKLRIDGLAKERESLRGLEWKTYFQLYVGYAAILAAYTYLMEHVRNVTEAHAIGVLAAAVSIAVWVIEVNLLRAIHDRMRASADLKRRYFERLHTLTRLEAFKERETLFGRRWATVPQFILSLAATLGIVAFEIWYSFARSFVFC